MKHTLLLIGAVVLFFASCKKETNEYPYRATVVGLNSDCGQYAIKITQGADEVAAITGTPTAGSIDYSTYIAPNLPADLKENGLSIKLNLRKPTNDEIGNCTTMGLAYSWIIITEAARE